MRSQRTSKQQILASLRYIADNTKKLTLFTVCGLLFLDILFVGNIAYGVTWVACGMSPVVVGSRQTALPGNPGPIHASIYTNPSLFQEKFSPLQNVFGDGDSLHCSLKEARAKALTVTDQENIETVN